MSKEVNYCLVPSKSPILLSTNEKQEHSENVYVLYTCTAHTQQALTEKIHWKQQSVMLSLRFFSQDATEPKTISASSIRDLCFLIAASRNNSLFDCGTNIVSLFQIVQLLDSILALLEISWCSHQKKKRLIYAITQQLVQCLRVDFSFKETLRSEQDSVNDEGVSAEV